MPLIRKEKKMTRFSPLHPELAKALENLSAFVEAVSGTPPTQEELALALNRYFVKKEICDTLVAERNPKEDKGDAAGKYA